MSARPTDPRLRRQVPLNGMRATIARRMHESLQSSAQLTLHADVDASALIAVRTDLRQRLIAKEVGYNDILLHVVSRALPEHPQLNATLQDGTISLWESINLGIAISVPDGLMVGVIRECHERSLASIATEAKRLADAAGGGRMATADVFGGTFTVSNLGAFGVDFFTPIVNPPQVAILGIGRIRESGVLGLSLTIDHRAVDGAPGGQFLSHLRAVLEDRERLLHSLMKA